MTIVSLSGLTGLQQQQNIKKTDAKLQAAIASLVSGQATDDVATVSIATQLQAQTSGLKQVSANLAEATSLSQVADAGIAQTEGILGDLHKIAQNASNGDLSVSDRQALNKQFQQTIAALNSNAENTQFNAQKLLDGSLSGDRTVSLDSLLKSSSSSKPEGGLAISDLSSEGLFGGQQLNVLSADAASDAVSVVGRAINQAATERTNVASFQQTLNYSSATIDTAVANQEAARSELQDSDFLDIASISNQAKVQQQANVALAAQGNRLPPSLLRLVS